jgi:23S rRNA pseudouridine2605 synthase
MDRSLTTSPTPSSEVEKEYELTLKNPVLEHRLAALAAGPYLEDGKMLPPRITNLRRGPVQTILNLTIHEGRNRIIRRACRAAGLDLKGLKRVRVGPVRLGSLPEGRYRYLASDELAELR